MHREPWTNHSQKAGGYNSARWLLEQEWFCCIFSRNVGWLGVISSSGATGPVGPVFTGPLFGHKGWMSPVITHHYQGRRNWSSWSSSSRSNIRLRRHFIEMAEKTNIGKAKDFRGWSFFGTCCMYYSVRHGSRLSRCRTTPFSAKAVASVTNNRLCYEQLDGWQV